MALGKLATKSAFKQTKGLTGGADKKIFKALKKAKIDKRRMAIEILWFFGAALIAFLAGFLVFYLIGEFLTEIFVDFITKLGSITKFYYWIFLFCFIGVYVARIIVWAIKMVAIGKKSSQQC